MLFLKTNASVLLRSCTYWLDFSLEPMVPRQNPYHPDRSDSGCHCLTPDARRAGTEIESHRCYRVIISLLVSLHELTSARRYQYFSAGRISIAPPRRAA